MTQQRPLISILIPTYNAPRFFRAALESARAQTYAPIEILICDNSTDDRTEQLMRVYRSDPRIHYIRNRHARTKEENFAPFEAMVHGEYIQWLMHDDVLRLDKLERMAAILDTHPEVTLVSSQRDIIDEQGKPIESNLQSHRAITGEYRIYDGEEYGNTLLRSVGNYIGEPSAVLFRRGDLDHPYYHAESRGYKRISDVAMWLELLEKGKLCLFREPLSSYRRHPGQEGQQLEVILECRCEWVRLLGEYWQRRVFLHSEAAYHEGLAKLWQDYQNMMATGFFRQHVIAAGLLQRYEQAMACVAKELGKTMIKPGNRITACLIYRDEAERLEPWLQAAAVYSDEMVLVDTGSQDGSADVATAFAQQASVPIRMLGIPWRDDFAAARNAALQAATGDWIVFLDADETFEQPELVRQALEAMPASVPGVLVPIINVDADAGGQEISRFPALRIWRAKETRRYVGRIHEALYEEGKPLQGLVSRPELTVRHTGYSTRRLQSKLLRNRVLLEQEMQFGTADPRMLYRYLADCCYGLADYPRALDYAMKAIEQEPPTVAGQQKLYVLVLDILRAMHRPLEEQMAFAEAAHREHPDWIDIQARYGLLAAEQGDTATARIALQGFLRAAKQPSMQATQAGALFPRVCRELGRLSLNGGDAPGAAVYLRQSLERSPYDEKTLSLWADCCEAKDTDFIVSLSSLYPETEETRDFLRGWVIHTGHADYRERLAPELEPVSYEEAVKRGAQEVPILFHALFAGGADLQAANPQLYEQEAALLPLGMQHILQAGLAAGENQTAELTQGDADSYRAGLDTMLRCRDRAVMKRYVQLAGSFGWPMVLYAAEQLAKQEEWSLAWSLYEQVPQDEIGDAAGFWYQAGRCLYHLHEAAAEECFSRAEAAGCTSPDIRAYRQWMRAWGEEEKA